MADQDVVAAMGMEAQLPAATAETPAEAPNWMHIFRIPGVVWHQLTLNEPCHTRAVLAGVSMSLLTFGRRKAAHPFTEPSATAGSKWPVPPPPPLVPLAAGEWLQCVFLYVLREL